MAGKRITQTAQIVSPPNYYQTIPVETSVVTMDEAWAPNWQASIRTPYTTQLAQIDPRQTEVIVEITTTEEYGRARNCGELTLSYSGNMAQLTTAFSGKTCAQITNLIYFPYDTALTGYIAPTVRTVRLITRSVDIRHVEEKIDFTLASEEALLQDYALIATSDQTPLPGNLSLVALVQYALTLIGRELFDYDSWMNDVYVPAEANKVWKPGTTAYDWIYNLIKGIGYLYCRYDGRFVFRSAHTIGEITPLTLDASNIISATEKRDRENNFYSAAIMTYRWTTGTTANEIVDAYDSGRRPIKVYTETANVPYPGPGAARYYLEALQAKGEQVEVTAIADWKTAWLENDVSLTLPTGTRTGKLNKASLHYPSDQMEITARIGLS